MSYIRCLSNPEGLYVYENAGGLVFCMPYPQKGVTCNTANFHEFIKRYDENNWDDFEWNDFSVKEENRNGDYKIYLKIDGIEFELWYVTWAHIVYEVLRRIST